MSKKKTKIYSIEIPDINEEIRKNLDLALSNEDYSIAVDIVNRSRELSKLYKDAKDIKKAITILEVMLGFCHNVEGMNNPEFFIKDIENIIELHKRRKDTRSIVNLLEDIIDKYPDYSSIGILKEQLIYWSKKNKHG